MCLAQTITYNCHRGVRYSESISKPCRPYTEYNLFFQLEREYILQNELGFQPAYEPSEIFDPSDASNYQGPPLPSRYSGLVYLYDWHLPGKEKRRKRRHRKTHGKIGFQELSLKIADAWKTVDAETRTFCADLCYIGQMQHKIAMKAFNTTSDFKMWAVKSEFRMDASHDTVVPTKAHKNKHCVIAEVPSSTSSLFEITSNGSSFIPTDHCSMAEVDAAFENDLALSLDNLYETSSDMALYNDKANLRSPLVDLEDDEIMDMWKSTPAQSDGEGTFNHHRLGNIVSFSASITREVSEGEDNTLFQYNPHGTNSYIDATMNDLVNMRKALINQQIQTQAINAAMIANYPGRAC
jgi:hypothetical protein